MFGHFIFSFYNERKFSVDCCVDLSIIDFHFCPIHFNHMSVYFSLTREIAVDSIYHYKNSFYKSIIWRRLRWPNRRPEIHYFQIKFTNTYVENIVHKWTFAPTNKYNARLCFLLKYFFFSKSESIEDYFGTLTVVHFESLIFFRCFLAVDQDCYSVWYFFLLLMVNTCEINLKIRHKSLIHTMSKARRQISLPGDQFYVWTNLR